MWAEILRRGLKKSEIQLKPVNRDSLIGDFLLIDMLFWEHFLYNAE